VTTAPRRAELVLLGHELDEAREACRRVREQPVRRTAVREAQQRYRRALEAYAAAVARRGLPLPHRLRVELATYRSLVVTRS
jgi:hypothetical protein